MAVIPTPEQVAAETGQREVVGCLPRRPTYAASRVQREPKRFRAYCAPRGAEFEDGLDAQLLHSAGYEAHDYCGDLLGARLTAEERRRDPGFSHNLRPSQ